MRRFASAIASTLIAVAALLAPPSGVPASYAGEGATVLIYHRFGERGLPSTNIRLEQFEAHLAEIATGAYNVLPLTDIVTAFEADTPLPERTLAITIDDAFLSVYTEAWPRLRDAGLPFALFVATGPIDNQTAGYMSWDHLREMVAGGVTIGQHTVSHLRMHELSRAENAAEIETARARFAAELGLTPQFFAYPFGEYRPAGRDLVEAAGFRAAFGQQSGVAHRGADRFTLPRFAMNETYGSVIRFRLVANALPLPVSEVIPLDPYLSRNPPEFGFTVDPSVGDLARLSCFASHETAPARLERLGARRIEVRMGAPFPPGRGRVNCTLPAGEGRWRWFGTQFIIPEDAGAAE